MTDISSPHPMSPEATEPPTPATAAEEASNLATTAVEQASSVASNATEQARTVAATAVDEAKAVGAQAATEAKELFADARQQLKAQAADQSDRLAQAIQQLGRQLRTMADAGEAGIARDVVTQVADQAQQVSARLSDGGLERTLDDARRLARNRPGVFLLGAAAAGFIAARVARNVETQALVDAAKPTSGSNGNGVSGPRPELPQAPSYEVPSSLLAEAPLASAGVPTASAPQTEQMRTLPPDAPGAPT